MHICHARRIGGPDGHDTVAGASTNVCGRPCCYLYRGETQTRKYLKKDSGPFLLGVKMITKNKQMGLNHLGISHMNFEIPTVPQKKLLVLEEKQVNATSLQSTAHNVHSFAFELQKHFNILTECKLTQTPLQIVRKTFKFLHSDIPFVQFTQVALSKQGIF